jgi:hypothetical protein
MALIDQRHLDAAVPQRQVPGNSRAVDATPDDEDIPHLGLQPLKIQRAPVNHVSL